jgi:two-component system response regulator MprA
VAEGVPENSRVPHFVVVDDDATERMVVAKVLRRAFAGCQVRECETPEEALECIGDDEQDALITDFNMPRMSGALLALELRKKHNHLPIVILSNSDRSGMASLEAGADAFLTKDLISDLPRIISGLAPWLGESRP